MCLRFKTLYLNVEPRGSQILGWVKGSIGSVKPMCVHTHAHRCNGANSVVCKFFFLQCHLLWKHIPKPNSFQEQVDHLLDTKVKTLVGAAHTEAVDHVQANRIKSFF